MDETGLFYRMQADNSLATRQLEGRRQNKERITITVCCNVDRFDKLPFWIIGKSFRPRCFKNINIDNLDCKYHANKNAWMTQNVFKLWLTALQCAHQRRRSGEVQHSAEEHNIALPAAKHHFENSAARRWNHSHIQGLLPPSIQQPTAVKD
jgi:hypothetical protein